MTTSDREPKPSDGPDYHADHAAWEQRNPTPGGLDALLAEADDQVHEIMFLDADAGRLVDRLAAALRAEQSARQKHAGVIESLGKVAEKACEAAATACNERDALRQRIDAALGLLPIYDWEISNGWALARKIRAALTAPTESKEPAPKLDPEPWTCIHCDKRGKEEYMIDRENRRFLPRPDFSQNPADYRIEAPHE